MKSKSLLTKMMRVALVVLLCVVSIEEVRAQDFTVDNLNYSINSDGTTVTVTGHVDGTAASGTLDIPASVSYDGMSYPVTIIGDQAFFNCQNLTGNLIIPNSVTVIGKYAFCNTDFIGSLNIPNSVKTIEERAFHGCYRFTGDLIIPNSVTTIESGVFCGCYHLNGNLIIPDEVISIGIDAFRDCSFTGELVISDKVYSIGESAFSGCQFTSITVNPANRHYKSVNGVLFSYDEKTLLQYPVEKVGFSYVIPNSVTRIGSRAFYFCENLTSINIPASVSSIGNNAFYATGWYERQEDGLLYLGDWCLGWKGEDYPSGELAIRGDTKKIAEYAFENMSNLTSLSLPDSLTFIGDYAFNLCVGLSGNLDLPNSLRTIGDAAFYGCTGFTGGLVLPSSLRTIGVAAFYGCMGFTGSLVLPNSLTKIGMSAFAHCNEIIDFNIPESVITIGNGVFFGTGWYMSQPDGIVYKDKWYLGYKGTASESLTLEEDARGIADDAFYNCHSCFTGDLTIPSSMVYIGNNAFYNCRNLTGDLIIPDSVKEIGEYAFFNCKGFSGHLILGNSLTKIGSGAFSRCENLIGTLIIPSSLTTLEDFAFYGCTGFSGDLVIPNSLTEIREGTFSDYTEGIMGFDGTLVIPETIIEIYDQAFCGCNNLQSITVYCETPPEIIKVWPDEEEDAFYGINKEIPVYVPCNSVNEYQAADYWNQFNNFQESLLYSLTIEAIEPEHCTVNIVQQPSCELQAIVKAEPAIGYTFVAWEEDGMVVSNDSIYTFTVDRNIRLQAKVKPNTGVSEGVEKSVDVYPNPTNGKITIEAEGLKYIAISNTLGQIIYEGSAGGHVFEYDFGKHGTGLYLIRIETAGGVVLKKVSVVR